MVDLLNDLLWEKLLLYGLIAIGLVFTISTRFVQFRYFFRMFGILRDSFRHDPGHISSFQALAVSIAGRVGSGNIAGVAVAITVGGPGAIFWMWLIGLIGMATSFFECSLAQLFKTSEPDGTYRGGPAYYIEKGLGKKWLAGIFSVFLLMHSGLFMTAFQSFTVAASLQDAFGIRPLSTGIGMAIVLGIIIVGGIKRIAAAAEMVVPVMALAYVAVALFTIILNFSELPQVFTLIVRSAFGLEPALGGGAGAAILLGVKRGLFSNEAGLGTAPNVAAIAYVKHPASQGMVQAFSVFIDTIVICTCTASIILLSNVYSSGAELDGIVLTQTALTAHVGEWGRPFISVLVTLFAFTSIMYSYYLGENCLNFFSEENQVLFKVFRLVILSLVIWGTLQDVSTIFAFADLMMGLVASVNLIALAMLFRIGLRLLSDFDLQIRAGISQPKLDVSKFADLNIDRRAWPE